MTNLLKMGKLVLLLMALIFAEFAHSQVVISGRVIDIRKKPLQGVSISIKDSYDGATTDLTGRFRFSTIDTGQMVLVASFLGYKTTEQTIRSGTDGLTIDITLKEEINELKAVVITAGTFEASDRKKATVLNPIDIVTTASANGDVTGALKTLPGAQQVGEKEGLFVRGGNFG